MTNKEYAKELLIEGRRFFHKQRVRSSSEAKKLFDNPDIRIAYVKLKSGAGFMEAVKLLDAQAEYDEYIATLNWDFDSSEMLAMKIGGFMDWLESEPIQRYAK